MKKYDVVVIGAGHAGCEAALAASRLGAKTAMLTMNLDHIAQMSCNPSIGGIAKGQLVREIDALGGAQGLVADTAGIQFRMLNRTKGPAVWSPRAQCDKVVYQKAMKLLLETAPNLELLMCEVVDFKRENDRITAVINQFGDVIECGAVVIATGTFLTGLLHYGLKNFPGGRAGDFPANALSIALRNTLNLQVGRLKTGTPPRLIARSIDFSVMEKQDSEVVDERFSFLSPSLRPSLPEAVKHDLPCYMVYSTDETANAVRNNLHQSPMYSGVIKGIGTRYCPSFEDKIMRFPDHPRHLLYLEPEGVETGEYYINGLSTSLPVDVQRQMVHSIPGLENAEISRYAYAIEYDFLPPEQLERSLKNKYYQNLFTAGQINGTSGYEEAAGQGLIAGMNAARVAGNQDVLELGRDSSYIGVMLDDISTKTIVEPYRLFTSRAEYRLTLRQDNADLRLANFAYKAGLLSTAVYNEYARYEKLVTSMITTCRENKASGKTLLTLLKTISLDATPEELPFKKEFLPEVENYNSDFQVKRAWRELLVEAHYDGYLQREATQIKRLAHLEELTIPEDFDYAQVPGLCMESRQKLQKIRPTSLGQAGRIDGVTPADIALLQVVLKKNSN